MVKFTRLVGLDVHAETTAVAVGRKQVRSLAPIADYQTLTAALGEARQRSRDWIERILANMFTGELATKRAPPAARFIGR